MKNFPCIFLLFIVFILDHFKTSALDDDYSLEWWEDSSLYHVYVRSFKDSDGDGIGDIYGVTSRLPHFKEIGIDAIWLSPIFKSPMADMGYDVSDFKEIEPVFGTLQDFEELVSESNKLGIKVILDMVINHASNESEWFQKSVRREDGFDEVFVWDDGIADPKNPGKRLPPNNWIDVFDFNSAWEWNDVRKQFYLHQFMKQQIDFNWRTPKVYDLFFDVFTYWLEKGVGGFRLDATNFLIEAQNPDGTYPNEDKVGEKVENRPENGEVLYALRAFMDAYTLKNGGDVRPLYSEAYAPMDFIKISYGNETHKGVQVPFNFNLIYTTRIGGERLTEEANAKRIEHFVNVWMGPMWNDTKIANWQTGNHDNERVTTRMGKHRTDLMNMLLAGLPGITVTYYGEELGMLDGQQVTEDRDPERTPMQWNRYSNAGFSTNSSTWLPLAPDWEQLNVEVERGAARSTLNIYKAMHRLKNTAAFKAYKRPGALEVGPINENVYQIVRSLPGEEEYRIFLNFGQTVENLCNISEKTMQYVVLNKYSTHRIGDKIDLKGRLTLMANEGVVLKWIK